MPVAQAVLPRTGDSVGAPEVEGFTVARYNSVCRRINRRRKWDVIGILIIGAITASLFFRPSFLGWPQGIQWITIAWLPGIPYILLLFFGYAVVAHDKMLILGDPPPLSDRRRRVLFTLVTLGVEIDVVERTVRSVLYWTARCARPDVETQMWLVVEEPGYRQWATRYDSLAASGVNLFVVPKDYRTPKGTTHKARALQFTQDMRHSLGLEDADTWVYHQDEETAVGEDTVRGIQELVLTAQEQTVGGAGLIAHPLDWDGRASQIRDLTHTFHDFQVLYTVRHRYNLTSWFHGSHLIVRADAEAAIGWDLGHPSFSEDSLMAFFLRQRYGWDTAFDILKGFAYESSPFSLRDQLKQRKRWFRSHFNCFLRRKDVTTTRKVLTVYSTVTWLSALPSFTGMVLSFTIGLHSTFPVFGAVTGVAWSTTVLMYIRGFDMNRDYLPTTDISRPRLVVNGLIGSLTDAVAPWYALFAGKTGVHDFISKTSNGVVPGGLKLKRSRPERHEIGW